jgi:hypothetical protein
VPLAPIPADGEVAVVLAYCDVAWAGMSSIVTTLGDERASRRPYDGANSPLGLLAHCLGVSEWWGGHALAGRVVVRDRAAEFIVSGAVAPWVARVATARSQLAADLAAYAPLEPPRLPVEYDPDDEDEPPPTQRSCLLHLYEELAQHHGQMQILRDLIPG